MRLAPISNMCPGNITPVGNVRDCYQTSPLKYLWKFGGGSPSTSSDLSPGTINFSTIGNDSVIFTVSDTACNFSVSDTDIFAITPPPVVSLPSMDSVCSGNTITLQSVPSNSNYSYSWSPVTGIIPPTASSNDSISIKIINSGSAPVTYPYTLTVSAGPGCSSTGTVNVVVKPGLNLAVNFDSVTICYGNSTTLIASGADNYNWMPSYGLTGPTNTASIVASPGTSTTYSVAASVANGCVDTLKVKVTVDSSAIAQIKMSFDTLCSSVNLDSVISAYLYPSRDSAYRWYANGVLVGSYSSASGYDGSFPSFQIISSPTAIKLVALAYGGCDSTSYEDSIYLYPAPIANFTQTPNKGCGPLAVTFSNNSPSQPDVIFSWHFGNGQSSNLPQPVNPVIYSSASSYHDTTYYDTLITTNSCGNILFIDSVIVSPGPRASFTPSQSIGCSPFNETFINHSSGISSEWNFGDMSPTLITNNTNPVSHTYNTGVIETLLVTLIETNGCGTDTFRNSIIISPSTITPGVALNVGSLFGCAPLNANFVNASAGAAIIYVDFGDGSSLTNIPGNQDYFNHTYTAPGVYIIKDSLINNCTDTSVYETIHIFPPTVPSFAIDTLICTGSTLTPANSSTGSNAFVWPWGDGDSSNGLSPAHAYLNPGYYQVTLTAIHDSSFGVICSSVSPPVTVHVVGLVPANIDSAGSEPCVPLNLKVSAQGADSAKDILWTFYDTSIAPYFFQANGPSASYQFKNPGNYEVKLVVTNLAGCSDSVIKYYQVYPSPQITNVSFGNIYTCNLDSTINIQLNTVYSGIDLLTYQWYINSNQASSGNPFNYQFQEPAGSNAVDSSAIIAVAKNSVGCEDSVYLGSIIIRPLPKPGILVSPDSILTQPDYTFTFTDSTNYAFNVSNLWDVGESGITRSGSSISFQYGDTGIYKIHLTVHDEVTGCSNEDSTKVRIVYVPGYLYVPDAICPGCSELKLRYFLPLGKGLKDYRLRIFNIWGQLIFETNKLDGDGAPIESWNAEWKGEPLQQDAYRWQIEAHYLNGTEWKGMIYPGHSTPVKSSFITLIK